MLQREQQSFWRGDDSLKGFASSKVDCGRKFDAVCAEFGVGLKKGEQFRMRVLAGQRFSLNVQWMDKNATRY